MIALGIDLDGVCADFTTGMSQALHATTGRLLLEPGSEPDVWAWPEAVGYTPAEVRGVWLSISASPLFWRALSPLPGVTDALRRLDTWAHDAPARSVYFLTSRVGIYAKQQTESWLREQGVRNPTVLLADGSRKSLLADGLSLTALIDDCPENLILRPGSMTAPVLCPHAYNASVRALFSRVQTLPTFVQEFAV